MHGCVLSSMEPRFDLLLHRWTLSADDDQCWLSCGLSADCVRTGTAVIRGPTRGALRDHPTAPQPAKVPAAAGRRKGAARPCGMGLRPTLPPARCSRIEA